MIKSSYLQYESFIVLRYKVIIVINVMLYMLQSYHNGLISVYVLYMIIFLRTESLQNWLSKTERFSVTYKENSIFSENTSILVSMFCGTVRFTHTRPPPFFFLVFSYLYELLVCLNNTLILKSKAMVHVDNFYILRPINYSSCSATNFWTQ